MIPQEKEQLVIYRNCFCCRGVTQMILSLYPSYCDDCTRKLSGEGKVRECITHLKEDVQDLKEKIDIYGCQGVRDQLEYDAILERKLRRACEALRKADEFVVRVQKDTPFNFVIQNFSALADDLEAPLEWEKRELAIHFGVRQAEEENES